MYKQVIVVEGVHDEDHLRKIIPGIETVSVNGSEVSNESLMLLEELAKTRELVLFFDPDYPGQRIRSLIQNRIPNCSHAFIKKSDGISKNKKKVGVEHATPTVILEALENILTYKEKEVRITNNDLYSLGLIGNKNSKELRDKVCNHYKIDYPNGKTFLKRLHMLGISKEDIMEVLR